ncbi:MAG: ATP-binding protein [Bacteroidales bacterium]
MNSIEPKNNSTSYQQNEIKRYINTYNWNNSLLGPLEEWPSILKTSLEICLASPELVFICWGPDHLLFYNDASASVLNINHSSVLGQPAEKIWKEEWKFLEPMVKEVIKKGEGDIKKHIPFPFPLKSGNQQNTFNLSITPLPVMDNQPSGAMLWFSEIKPIRKFSEIKDTFQKNRKLYRDLAANLPNGAAFIIDREYRYILAEGQELKNTGMTTSKVEGKYMWDTLEPHLLEEYKANYEKALRGVPFKSEYQSHGGYFISSGTPLYDSNKKIYGVLIVSYDITDHKTAELVLKEREKVLQLATNAARLGVFKWEIEKDIPHWENERMYEIFGIPTESNPATKEYLTKRIIHPDDLPLFEKKLHESIRRKKTFHIQCRIKRQNDRRLRWIEYFGVFEFSNEDKSCNMIGIVNDITERKIAQQELMKARDEAEKAAKAKDEFLSHMSHEIRTPLHSVIGITDLLIQKKPRKDQQKYLHALSFSSRNLLNLINDILDFSKIESGNITLEENTFNLPETMHNIRQVYENRAKDNNTRLKLMMDENVPDYIITDQLKLSQVMNNLVSNAVKFTREGAITIKINLVTKENNRARLRFSVADTGIGIKKEKLNLIFDKFTQVHDVTIHQQGGTGLGLTITKMLIELMGSKIEVYSTPDVGSVFSFVLDVKISKKEGKTNAEDGPKAESILNKSILLAEDVEINRMIIVQYLKEWWNLIPDEVTNGKEAVEKAKENNYDLILMDLRMPEMDGYEATRQIKTLQNKKKTPIIALTADTEQNIKQHPAASLFSGFITKPFDPNDLKKKILQNTIQDPLQPDLQPEPPVQFNRLKTLCKGDKSKFSDMCNRAASDLKGYKKLFMEALQNHDIEKIDRVKHKAATLINIFHINEINRLLEKSLKLLANNVTGEELKLTLHEGEILFDKTIEEIDTKVNQSE